MAIVDSIKSEIAKNKILFSFGYSYISWAGWGLVVVHTLIEYWPFSLVPFPILLTCGFIGIWTLGFTLHRLGIYNKEQSFLTANNAELLKHLNEAKIKSQ